MGRAFPKQEAEEMAYAQRKRKKKIPEYGTDRDESDRRESASEKSDDGPSRAKSVSAKKASTPANEQLRRSTSHKLGRKGRSGAEGSVGRRYNKSNDEKE